MSIYRWAKLDDQSGPDRSIELTSISGWAGKKPSQEGLVFGSVARPPLGGPLQQWGGRQKHKTISNTPTKRSRPEESTQVVSSRHFRLIDHWKRESVSGSLCVGIKFRFQAHSTIGKCSPKDLPRKVIR